MSQVRALIVEKQPIFREALKAILTDGEGFNVIGETVSVKEVCNVLQESKPQVVITSCFRDHVLGLCAIRQASSLDIGSHFVVFVDPQISSAAEIQKLLCSTNVLGLLSPDVSTDEIKSAVRKACDGDYFIDGRITELLAGADSLHKTYNLSLRQLQVLKMIADGFTNKRISSELGISQDTVKTHVRTILKKLDASDRAQAVSKAYKADILHQSAPIH
ncbi:MAG: response regulator transcription factor [Rubrobacteridae bacterium]|nr:response regulator transcription factor [Rubrobacteridae bacterium]